MGPLDFVIRCLICSIHNIVAAHAVVTPHPPRPLPSPTPALLNSVYTLKSANEIAVQLDNSFRKMRHQPGTPGSCALECSARRASSPPCVAFAFDKRTGVCGFYTLSASKLETHILLFQFELVDKFHTISVGDTLYSAMLPSQEKNYADAKQHCKSLGGRIFTLDHKDKRQVVRILVPSGVLNRAFVSDEDGDDGISHDYSSGSGNNGNNACPVINLSSLQVEYILCDLEINFMCEKQL